MGDWRGRAACRGVDTEVFFAPSNSLMERKALSICGGCTVSSECLEEALAQPEEFGIYGMHTPQERRQIMRQRNNDARDLARIELRRAA